MPVHENNPLGAYAGICQSDSPLADLCDPPAQAQPAAQPQLTLGMIAQAFQEIPLPRLNSQTQPVGKTLVNFDTIFYVQAEPLDRQVVLLGQTIDLRIRPSTFTWTYGDGSSQTTTTPGAKYPRKLVVHRYPKSHVDLAHHVAVTWTADFRVNGGAWYPVPGTVTTVGADTPLHVSEAVPVLTGYGH